mmetsp:Transcript_6325/g.13058  ORF Transcript_6325/g.13058 Transcript_6325/m.13058 type:complete len:252 (+) Transcript_6325:2151-2906(+)
MVLLKDPQSLVVLGFEAGATIISTKDESVGRETERCKENKNPTQPNTKNKSVPDRDKETTGTNESLAHRSHKAPPRRTHNAEQHATHHSGFLDDTEDAKAFHGIAACRDLGQLLTVFAAQDSSGPADHEAYASRWSGVGVLGGFDPGDGLVGLFRHQVPDGGRKIDRDQARPDQPIPGVFHGLRQVHPPGDGEVLAGHGCGLVDAARCRRRRRKGREGGQGDQDDRGCSRSARGSVLPADRFAVSSDRCRC